MLKKEVFTQLKTSLAILKLQFKKSKGDIIMTIEKSVYNFKDDGTLITMPENILVPNVKPRTGLHVKYLTPLMHYQMSSKQKPNVLILGSLKDADAYSKLAQAHEYASNIPTLDGIVQFDQLNKVDLNLCIDNKPHMYFYAVPPSSDPSNVTMRILTNTLLSIMDYHIKLHIEATRPLKVYIDDSGFNLLSDLDNNVLNYVNTYLAIGLGQNIQFIIASKSDPRMMSGVLAANSTTVNLDDYSINLDRYNESLGRKYD